MSVASWCANRKMHSVGRSPAFSCMPVMAGHGRVHQRDLEVGGGGARVGEPARGLGRRDREERLPEQRHAVRRILHQQLVQQRGAAAAEARHEDRGLDALRQHRGALPDPLLDAQAVLEDALDLAPREEPPEQREPRLALERGEQLRERAPEPVVAEIVEAGRCTRGSEHGGLVERDETLPLVAEVAAERVQVRDPRLARRRRPARCRPAELVIPSPAAGSHARRGFPGLRRARGRRRTSRRAP